MNKSLFVTCLLAFACLHCSNGPDKIAGGTTDSGNARVSATVFYDNRPVSNATVRFRPIDYVPGTNIQNTCVKDTFTDSQGNVSFTVGRDGQYTLEIIKHDSIGAYERVTINRDFDNHIGCDTLPLSKTGSISGFLREPSLARGKVNLVGFERQAVIDQNGRFIFGGLAPGDYTLMVEPTMHDTITIPHVTTVSSKNSSVEDIDPQNRTWTMIAADTWQADSVLIQAFLDSQAITESYTFDDITVTIDGRIRTLDLSGLKMKSLHSSIAECDFLFTLNVSDNLLTRIPSQIEHCRLLSAFIAENNSLEALPAEMSRLSYLEFLKVSHNSITGLPDSLYFLPRLRKLSIGDNPIDSLPSLIENLAALEQLDIYQCALDRLPESIANLTKLQQLWASRNTFTILPESITGLPHLEILQVSFNRLIALPEHIGTLTSLKELDLYSNELTDLPPSIITLNLQKLDINKNRLCTVSAETAQWIENHTDPKWLSQQDECQ